MDWLLCLLVVACSYVIWRGGPGTADTKMAGFPAAVEPATLLLALIVLWVI